MLHYNSMMSFQEICGNLPLSSATIQDHLLRLQHLGLLQVMGDARGQVGYQLMFEVYEDMLRKMGGFVRDRLSGE